MRITIPNKKKFNKQRKVLGECSSSFFNIIVPRKLRSSLAKRRRESASSDREDEAQKKIEVDRDKEGAYNLLYIYNSVIEEIAVALENEDVEPVETSTQLTENEVVEPVEASNQLTVFQEPVQVEPVSVAEPILCLTNSSNDYNVVHENNPDITAAMASAVEKLQFQHLAIDKNPFTGFCQGSSSSGVSMSANTSASLVSTPFAFNSAWEKLSAQNTQSGPLMITGASEECSRDPFLNHPSWKRSSVHGHLGHFINEQKTSNKTTSVLETINQLIEKEGSKRTHASPKSTLLTPFKDGVPCLTLAIASSETKATNKPIQNQLQMLQPAHPNYPIYNPNPSLSNRMPYQPQNWGSQSTSRYSPMDMYSPEFYNRTQTRNPDLRPPTSFTEALERGIPMTSPPDELDRFLLALSSSSDAAFYK